MKSQDMYKGIFKNREELNRTILKTFLDISGIHLSESRKDFYENVIDKIIAIIEKDLNKQITKKDQKESNLSSRILSISGATNISTYNLNQLIQINIICRNILIEKISLQSYNKFEAKDITNSIWNLTDLYILVLCKKLEMDSTNKSKRDNNIIENLKIVKNDLQKQLDLTYQLIKNSPIAMAGCDFDLNVKLWNPIAENLTGYKQPDIIGKSILNIFTAPSQIVIKSQLSLALHRRMRINLNFQTKEGGIFNGFVLIKKLKAEMKQKIHYIINFVDLSKDEKLKSQLEKIEQLSAIARLSDAMMHDIRNPINSLALNIDVLTQLLSERSTEIPNISEIIDKINRQISNLTHNLHRYVGYSRITELKLESIDIREPIDELILDIRHRLVSRHIKIRYHRSNTAQMIKGDWNQLIRVVENLINNAIDSIEDKGNIDVFVRKRNKKVNISIEDDGQGIKSENLQNVFKPYFTTKDKGSGLGLFIVREIVRAHHGRVYCTSSDDQGTRFTVSIPAIVYDDINH
jgi:PAS domain S-box-containing protein